MAVAEKWLQMGEGKSELMARNHSFFKVDGGSGKMVGGKLTLVAEKHDAKTDHKLGNQKYPNTEAVEANIAPVWSARRRTSQTGELYCPSYLMGLRDSLR